MGHLHRAVLCVVDVGWSFEDNWTAFLGWLADPAIIFAIAAAWIRFVIAIRHVVAAIEDQSDRADVQCGQAKEALNVLRAGFRHRQQAELILRACKAPSLVPRQTLFSLAVKMQRRRTHFTSGHAILAMVKVSARCEIPCETIRMTLAWVHIVLCADNRHRDERQQQSHQTFAHFFSSFSLVLLLAWICDSTALLEQSKLTAHWAGRRDFFIYSQRIIRRSLFAINQVYFLLLPSSICDKSLAMGAKVTQACR